MDRTYIWYTNLKQRSMHDLEHIVFLLNIKFFNAEAKFS